MFSSIVGVSQPVDVGQHGRAASAPTVRPGRVSAPDDRLLDGPAVLLLVPMLLCMLALLGASLIDPPPMPGRPW